MTTRVKASFRWTVLITSIVASLGCSDSSRTDVDAPVVAPGRGFEPLVIGRSETEIVASEGADSIDLWFDRGVLIGFDDGKLDGLIIVKPGFVTESGYEVGDVLPADVKLSKTERAFHQSEWVEVGSDLRGPEVDDDDGLAYALDDDRHIVLIFVMPPRGAD